MAQLKDLIVNGTSRLIGNVFTNKIQITAINAPTASNGTTYGPGTSGQVLKSNGTSVYWAADDNSQTVTGVKGESESTYRIGQVNITRANLGLGSLATKNGLAWNEITQSGANSLPDGNSDFTDNTELLTSYASNNGFADTNAPGQVYKRDAICMYNYIKTKASGTWGISITGNASSANDISTGTPVLATATESNAITVIDLGNNVPATDQAQRHALDFKWYNSHWAIGNLRTGTSTSAGFGFSYSPDGTNWANKLIIGTNGSITIGHRETATSPSSATSSTRLTIIPYFHIGGPWTINSVDDSTNAYLTIKYGSSQITSLRHDGYMTAVRVYGAVWNDYAEYRKDNPNENQEPGRCVKELGNGALALTTKRLERGCEIISDTFGFAIGQDEENGYNTPIASNGRVLAYPYESIEEFAVHIGWPVCSGPNGTVSIMTEEEEEKYPSRIIGTISEIPTYEEWGTGNVKVNGRVWIRIR